MVDCESVCLFAYLILFSIPNILFVLSFSDCPVFFNQLNYTQPESYLRDLRKYTHTQKKGKDVGVTVTKSVRTLAYTAEYSQELTHPP